MPTILKGPWANNVILQDNPYSIVRRGVRFCVVKTDTGELMKCYTEKEKALAYHRALEAATRGEH